MCVDGGRKEGILIANIKQTKIRESIENRQRLAMIRLPEELDFHSVRYADGADATCRHA